MIYINSVCFILKSKEFLSSDDAFVFDKLTSDFCGVSEYHYVRRVANYASHENAITVARKIFCKYIDVQMFDKQTRRGNCDSYPFFLLLQLTFTGAYVKQDRSSKRRCGNHVK
jgi:hypothetical protein